MEHGYDCDISRPPHFRHRLRSELGFYPEQRQKAFEIFREIHGVRDFRLVLCADVFGCMMESAVQILKYIVREEREKGGLDYLSYEPLVISERRTPRTRCSDDRIGWSILSVEASAL